MNDPSCIESIESGISPYIINSNIQPNTNIVETPISDKMCKLECAPEGGEEINE